MQDGDRGIYEIMKNSLSVFPSMGYNYVAKSNFIRGFVFSYLSIS